MPLSTVPTTTILTAIKPIFRRLRNGAPDTGTCRSGRFWFLTVETAYALRLRPAQGEGTHQRTSISKRAR